MGRRIMLLFALCMQTAVTNAADATKPSDKAIESVLLGAIEESVEKRGDLKHLAQNKKTIHSQDMMAGLEDRQAYTKEMYANFLNKKLMVVQQFSNRQSSVNQGVDQQKQSMLQELRADLERFKQVDNFNLIAPGYCDSGKWASDSPMEIIAAYLYEKTVLAQQGKKMHELLERKPEHAALITAFDTLQKMEPGKSTKPAKK